MTGEILDYLIEKVKYDSGLHSRILLTSIENYPIHIHEDIQLIYVVKGEIELRVSYDVYELIEGDIHIVNLADTHSIKSNGSSNQLLILYFETSYFIKKFPNLYDIIFLCDENFNRHNRSNTNSILKNMIRILADSNEQSQGFSNRINEKSTTILSTLIENFQFFSIKDKRFSSDNKYKDDIFQTQRIQRIIGFIYVNYMNKMNLDQIAENESISKYYLSHLMKYATGYGFQDFVSFVRVEQTEKLVLGTSMSMVKIAFACGFSSVKYFSKHFKEFFGMSPVEYRAKFKDQTILTDRPVFYAFDKNESIQLLKKKMFAESSGTNSRQVIIDFNNRGDANSKKKLPIGEILLWDISQGLSQRYLNKLKDYKETIGLQRIRINKIFEIAGDNSTEYSWDWVSLLFDWLAKNEIRISILIDEHLLGAKQDEMDDKLISFFTYCGKKYGEYIISHWQIMVLTIGGGDCPIFEFSKFSERFTNRILTFIPAEWFINKDGRNELFDGGYIPSLICDEVFNKEERIFTNSIKLSDEFNNYMESGAVFNGESGLVTSNGLKKASYYTYFLLSKLGKTIIASDADYVVTRDGRNLQVLFFNSNITSEIERPEAVNALGLTYYLIKLMNIDSEYRIRKYLLKYSDSCYQQWRNLGSPKTIRKEDYESIYNNAYPDVEFECIAPKSAHEITLSLHKLDVLLMTFEPLIR